MTGQKFWRALVPRSLLSRMLLLLLLAILLSQTILTGIWMQQIQKRELEGMLSTTRNLALSAASTVNFFKSLPLQYRHIALDQLRNMGGSRFFVSLNEEEIHISAIPDSERKTLVLKEVQEVLSRKLSDAMAIKVDFSRPEELHVFNNDTLLADLPSSWARYTLSLEPINPPVLVTQIEIEPGEWLYLAALLPAPYMTLDDTVMPSNQVRFIALMTVFLCFFTFMLVRWQTRPLRRLAKAAVNLGKDIDQPSLKEEGASEIVAATRAFNIMQQRIRRFIDDRERLFSSISHDLKTPITRLRLRSPEAVPVIERLEAEHRVGDARIRALEAALDAYEQRGAAGFAGFQAAVVGYIEAEWRHMNAEEHEIFPLAERDLQADDWAAIDAAFLANDNPWSGPAGAYERLFSQIVNIAPAPVGLGPG